MRDGIVFVVMAASLAAVAHAQVTKPAVPGVTNFATVESTIACAGATTPAAVAEIKRMGFASIVNLRQASEAGVELDAEAAAAKEAGVAYVHLPLNSASPDPAVADRFIEVARDPTHQPMFVHCASGNRAAAMWLIKRLVVDGWDEERASSEAAALGLTNPALKKFALDYAASRKR